MFNFFKTPYRQKRAMVLWRRSYKKKLLDRAQALKYKYEINNNEVLLNKPNYGYTYKYNNFSHFSCDISLIL